MSSEVTVTSGVQQGSVLGVLFFLLCINDLPQDIKSQVRLFANDTTIYLTVGSSEGMNTLQTDLDTPQEWEWTLDMEFNTGKCLVLQIGRSKKPVQSQCTLQGQLFEAVDSAKYLGLTTSKDLNRNSFVKSLQR